MQEIRGIHNKINQYEDRVTESINKTLKEKEKIKDITLRTSDGDIVLCIVVEGE